MVISLNQMVLWEIATRWQTATTQELGIFKAKFHQTFPHIPIHITLVVSRNWWETGEQSWDHYYTQLHTTVNDILSHDSSQYLIKLVIWAYDMHGRRFAKFYLYPNDDLELADI